ncbi:MAG TPA: STAS/SEC14 domain-containing protein [Chromatiaceae bacterium]|nr:STAS/SEC14 domain-containing protein [Chromatiaceae bacterium]
MSHLKFVKNHHRKLSCIALVTDSGIGNLAEKLTAHFVSAEVKQFPHEQYQQARNWVGTVEFGTNPARIQLANATCRLNPNILIRNLLRPESIRDSLGLAGNRIKLAFFHADTFL